jgi:Cdc6-like AAA superfamily ATPase
MTRLERFRTYVRRMNPSSDPRAALDEGLYVSPPRCAAGEDLATRLELEPDSSHLVIGATGAGKTSELLQAAARLKASLPEAGDHVEYIDVSLKHELSAPKLSGVLVALAGLSLASRVRENGKVPKRSELAASIRALEKHANRWWLHQNDIDHEQDYGDAVDDDEFMEVPGVIVPPKDPIDPSLAPLVDHLRILQAAYPGDGKHAVFLFDSLDRLPEPERFREVVQDDLPVLKAAGIGVAIVGPIRYMVGTDRSVTSRFDQTHFRLGFDPALPSNLTFLSDVLRKRSDADFLTSEAIVLLARASGGVLRDLISLAKRAGQEAYAAGHDRVTEEDVKTAIDAFGRSLAVGLDDEQAKMLRHLHGGGGFVIRGERELSLLETGRVLFYEGNRWVVHPTLVPLLDAMIEAA